MPQNPTLRKPMYFSLKQTCAFSKLFPNMLPCSIVCVYSQHFIYPNEKLLMGIGFSFMAPRLTLCTTSLKTTTTKRMEGPRCHCSMNKNHIRKSNWSAGLGYVKL